MVWLVFASVCNLLCASSVLGLGLAQCGVSLRRCTSVGKRAPILTQRTCTFTLIPARARGSQGLMESLPPLLQYLAAQVDVLKTGTLEEQIKAIQRLGES